MIAIGRHVVEWTNRILFQMAVLYGHVRPFMVDPSNRVRLRFPAKRQPQYEYGQTQAHSGHLGPELCVYKVPISAIRAIMPGIKRIWPHFEQNQPNLGYFSPI